MIEIASNVESTKQLWIRNESPQLVDVSIQAPCIAPNSVWFDSICSFNWNNNDKRDLLPIFLLVRPVQYQ